MADPFPQFGVAIDGIFDVGKTFAYVTGLKNLGNRVARRMTTPTGSLFYDLRYGRDIRQLLNAGTTDAQVRAESGEQEKNLELDDMIEKATVTITRDVASMTLFVKVRVITSDGPFAFVMAITQLSVEILSASGAQ